MAILEKQIILDGKWLFNYYFTDMGSARSIRKLVKYLTAQGKINYRTGRPVTDMAVWFSIWYWAMYHSEEAYQIFNKAAADEGDYWSPEKWEVELQKRAWLIAKKNTNKFNKWLKHRNQERQIA